MDSNEVAKRQNLFDGYAHEENGVEFWYARDIMEPLGYTRWENFSEAIKRAMASCESAKCPVVSHFRDVTKMVQSGVAPRKIADYKLTRYACYLIAQNGDPRKEEIAFAQSYFALQTRRQELIEERMKALSRIELRERLSESEKQLSKNIYERGVDEHGFARIRSKGDAALFGHPTAEMKRRLGVPERKPLADHLPSVTIAAKQLTTEMTNINVEQQDLHGEPSITSEHVQNNSSVRGVLLDRGIIPENLPAEEDVKKLKRKVDKDGRLLEREAKGFA